MIFEQAHRIIMSRTCHPCRRCLYELEQICIEEINRLRELTGESIVKIYEPSDDLADLEPSNNKQDSV